MGKARAYEVAGFKPGTFVTAADLSAKQFFAAKLDANGEAVLGTDGALCLGAIQNKPILGEAVEFDLDGIVKAVAGAAIAAGAQVASNAAGKFITAVATKNVVGVALQPATGDGSIFAMKVIGLSGHVL